MKTIAKDKEQAILNAKTNTIREFEQKEDFSVPNEEIVINDSHAWLVTDMTAECHCGETRGVEVVLFANMITTTSHEQYRDYMAYCENCSSN